jgi:HK97 family phage portal protein
LNGTKKVKWYRNPVEAVKQKLEKWVDDGVKKAYDFSLWENTLFWGIGNNTLETNEAIFASITRLSSSMGSLPLKLKKDFKTQWTDTADRFINDPHGALTIYDVISRMETIRNEKGNVYALIERDIYGLFQRLHLLNSDVVEPAIEKDNREVWYLVRGDNGKRHAFYHTEVLHLKGTVKNNSIKAIGPIDVLKNTSDFDTAVREFSLKEMKKHDSFVIKYGANVDEKKKKEVTDNFRNFYRNNGGVIFQEPGVEIDPIKKEYVSADIVAAEGLTRERVANVFQIPLAFLNSEKGIKFSKLEDLNRYYVQHTLLPIMRQYELELNRKLLTKEERMEGYYFKFNEKGLLRGDMATQMDAYFKGIRTGIYKPNEVRNWEDLPSDEHGDELFVSGDLYPISMDPEERKGTSSGGGEENE